MDYETFFAINNVSRETFDNLNRFVMLLQKWQQKINLVASHENNIWHRHVADSLNLLKAGKNKKIWLDLGSGAGFPGIILAIALKESYPQDDSLVIMVESNHKKAAFLRQAIHECNLNARVICDRIEDIQTESLPQPHAICARALAPLPQLCHLIYPFWHENCVGFFHKGKNFRLEIEEARKIWHLSVDIHKFNDNMEKMYKTKANNDEINSVILQFNSLYPLNSP